MQALNCYQHLFQSRQIEVTHFGNMGERRHNHWGLASLGLTVFLKELQSLFRLTGVTIFAGLQGHRQLPDIAAVFSFGRSDGRDYTVPVCTSGDEWRSDHHRQRSDVLATGGHRIFEGHRFSKPLNS